MRTATLGTALTLTLTATTALTLTLTAPAHADAGGQVLLASCTATMTGTYTSPLDPGSTDAQQPDSLPQTGTVTCVDDAGQPLVRGTVTRTADLPAAQCSGITYSDPSTTRIAWADGTTTTLTLDQATVIAVLGTASTTGTGTATPDSTKFTGDSIDAAVMTSGPGCGTAKGQTDVASTMVFTLAH
ncbi:hypothetical protein ABIA35_004550 [Catenulispora sp. MAP12-49]|uniref:hypothetical protein n=1 Tax=Catenulispora sp. MAP12-49 TaxID=3156302 RepID=UPI003514730C